MPREFLSRLTERGGIQDPPGAETIANAVLSVFSERLGRIAAERLAEALPPSLGRAVLDSPHGRVFGVEELYQRVANRLGIRAGVAVEHTVSVLRTVAEVAGDDLVERLREDLPPDIDALLVVPEAAAPPPPIHRRPDGTTLAEGHGGSSRPLFAAKADRAHTHSVARNDNPHGDTKLSSARGLSQEREGDTLAEGKPGSKRPLSGPR